MSYKRGKCFCATEKNLGEGLVNAYQKHSKKAAFLVYNKNHIEACYFLTILMQEHEKINLNKVS